jgi:DNA-directed RNA polymerase specialized sigma24 family protein
LVVDFHQVQTTIYGTTEVKMLGGARQIANQKTTPYASGADFCRIFEKDMDSLYLLSFLLTGDRSMAERCFVRGLDDSRKGNRVFKEWAQSWARRTIIQNAIRMIRPRPTDRAWSSSTSDRRAGHAMTEPAEVAWIVELTAFDRFAFVMSVLERYSDQECSLLLDCTRGEVIAARARALKQSARSVELDGKPVSIDSDEQVLPDNPGSVLQPQAAAQLAASA